MGKKEWDEESRVGKEKEGKERRRSVGKERKKNSHLPSFNRERLGPHTIRRYTTGC